MGLSPRIRSISHWRIFIWTGTKNVRRIMVKDEDQSILESFSNSASGALTTNFEETSKPFVVRGIVKRKEIRECEKQGRDYYYIDTGYVGNFPSRGNSSGKKIWHRIVKNNVQHTEIIDRPMDRWNTLITQDPRLNWSGWKDYNKKILLVLPNPKATNFYGIDCDTWINEITEKIKTYCNLPIEVRSKGTRSFRNHGYSIYDAFDTGIYATVSFNSIASLESVLYGIPAFVSVPCAASPLASNDLSQLKNPYKPSKDIILKQCYNIAYGQFSVGEINNGTAYQILKNL